MTPNVRIHVERLVLHGFEHVNRPRLDAALSAELSRLVAAHGAPDAPGRVPYVDAGTIRATPAATAETLGVQIAQAIYGGLR